MFLSFFLFLAKIFSSLLGCRSGPGQFPGIATKDHHSFLNFLFFNSKIWFFLLLNPRLFLPKPLIDAVRRRCLKNLSQAEEKVRKWTSATLPFDLEPNHWRRNSRKISIHKKLLLLVISLSQSSVKFMQGSNYLFTPSTSTNTHTHTHKHTLTHTCPLPRHTYLWTHTHTHSHWLTCTYTCTKPLPRHTHS